jgi:dihydroorotate dehydrogenase
MYIGRYELEAPLINGGGLVKSPEDVLLMARTAVGAVLYGSTTLEERAGNGPNGETTSYFDPVSGIMYNALGMPNRGMAYTAEHASEMVAIAHDHGKPFMLNFAPVSDDPQAEVHKMGQMLNRAGVQYLDAIELNASCPNVVTAGGGRHELLSHHPEMLGDVLMALEDVAMEDVEVGMLTVRISPFRKRSDAFRIAEVVTDLELDAVTAFNTFPGGVPARPDGSCILEVPGGIGGMSGPGMHAQAELQTQWLADARDALGGRFDIIGSNGVATGEAMKRRLDIGAAAVSSTTIFWEAKSWGAAADTLLREYVTLFDKI